MYVRFYLGRDYLMRSRSPDVFFYALFYSTNAQLTAYIMHWSLQAERTHEFNILYLEMSLIAYSLYRSKEYLLRNYRTCLDRVLRPFEVPPMVLYEVATPRFAIDRVRTTQFIIPVCTNEAKSSMKQTGVVL
jgi:hypothetical protein